MGTAVEQVSIVLRCLDKRYEEALTITKKKSLLGSADTCDIRLSEDFISSYHALIYIKDSEGFLIKDLYSHAGIFVNGQRIQEGFIGHGDVLSIGNLSFSVEIVGEVLESLIDDDSNITVINAGDAPEIPEEEGLVFIDGDFCNIIFDESHFKPLKTLPELVQIDSYVDLDPSVEDYHAPGRRRSQKRGSLHLHYLQLGLKLGWLGFDLGLHWVYFGLQEAPLGLCWK